MKLRKAVMEDLREITAIFINAIKNMNENGIPQWDEIYPNETHFLEDIKKNQMYVAEAENGITASAFVINESCDAEYDEGNWQYPDASYRVVHRFCVNPVFQNQGIGRKSVLAIEKLLREEGVESIRLDAFSLNPFALRMYEHLYFRKVGEVNFRKGRFYLYEKYLE